MNKEWKIAAPGAFLASESDAGYRVFVRDLIVPCSLGIYLREKGLERRVRVNAEIAISEAVSGNDDFAEVVNYESIVAGIKAVAQAGHINLVETLAERIAAMCLADARVSAARVVVEKLEVYPDAESVGVAIERRRSV